MPSEGAIVVCYGGGGGGDDQLWGVGIVPLLGAIVVCFGGVDVLPLLGAFAG